MMRLSENIVVRVEGYNKAMSTVKRAGRCRAVGVDKDCNIATLSSLTLVGSVSSSSGIVLGIEMHLSSRRSLIVQRAKLNDMSLLPNDWMTSHKRNLNIQNVCQGRDAVDESAF